MDELEKYRKNRSSTKTEAHIINRDIEYLQSKLFKLCSNNALFDEISDTLDCFQTRLQNLMK